MIWSIVIKYQLKSKRVDINHQAKQNSIDLQNNYKDITRELAGKVSPKATLAIASKGKKEKKKKERGGKTTLRAQGRQIHARTRQPTIPPNPPSPSSPASADLSPLPPRRFFPGKVVSSMECVRSGALDLRCQGKVFGSATSCGKAGCSTNLAGSAKHNLHAKAKHLHLSASGTSSLVHRGPVLKHQRSLAVRSAAAADAYTTFDENVKGVASHAVEEKVGVLLFNLGGPETLNDVQPFLFNLFADPDIIRLPRLFRFLQRPLAKLISTLRAPKSKEAYASIGGGSPLRRITDEQANALKIALKEKNMEADIYVGMRYWYPFTEEAFDQIKKDKITKLVVLPLYPQYSISTSGSSIRVLQNIVKEDAFFAGLPISIIESWYQREGYVKSMADLIEKELTVFSNPEEVMIFFSAHGVPLTYVQDAGDPYRDQMEDCIALIMEELKSRGTLNNHTLAYQSRVGPIQWLKPYTDEVLVELGQKGVKSLLAVPVSFVSEHIETLEEIDMEYRELALESGIENWGRVPALGCTSSFISDLADAVVEALPSASALTTRKVKGTDSDMDMRHYLSKMFFGSVLAFFLLLSPRLVSAFRNTLR